MKEAKKYNESEGGYTNYYLYIIGVIALLLIVIVLIMPIHNIIIRKNKYEI